MKDQKFRKAGKIFYVKLKDILFSGQVIDCPSASPLVQLTIRSVSFQWQRGNKIGEGSFGRVFTCVNTNSGKILAMKEVNVEFLFSFVSDSFHCCNLLKVFN